MDWELEKMLFEQPDEPLRLTPITWLETCEIMGNVPVEEQQQHIKRITKSFS